MNEITGLPDLQKNAFERGYRLGYVASQVDVHSVLVGNGAKVTPIRRKRD